MTGNNTETDQILKETIENIKNILGPRLDEIKVERVVIGIFFTGVKLTTGEGGLCYTPVKAIPEAVCCPSSARAMPNSGSLTKRPISLYFDDALSSKPIRKALGIAVINALSDLCWKSNPPVGYTITKGIDAMDTVEIYEDDFVVVIGALAPLLKVLLKRGKSFNVIEQDPRTLKPDEMPFFVPVDKTNECVPKADLLVITGTTLINSTLEGLLSLAHKNARIVVMCPTASMLPDAFFKRGVDILGGDIVTKPDELLDVIAEGGSGYHFFEKSADRVVFTRKT